MVHDSGISTRSGAHVAHQEEASSADQSVAARGAGAVRSSRIPGFAKLSAKQRIQALLERGIIDQEDIGALHQSGALSLDLAQGFIENCVGGFTLPLGLASNFLIDGQEVLVPMAVEESSVVAAASHGAKLARSGGGFTTQPTQTIATSQIQLSCSADYVLENDYQKILDYVKTCEQKCHQRLLERGGGLRSIEVRRLAKPGFFVLHMNVDTREAMGANIVNTLAEEVGRGLPALVPCVVGLKILTNLTVHRLTTVSCEVSAASLEMGGFSGEQAVERICAAAEFAALDPFRAATHNKGIMNGIDPVVIATGNDWRAVEAGCHAYAALSGCYAPLTTWSVTLEGNLRGQLTAPIAVGTVGGVTRLHPSVRAVLKVLGNPSSGVLSGIIAAVGLAQNLSALRALACEGIQRGHMSLHERNLEMLRRYDHVPPLAAVSLSE